MHDYITVDENMVVVGVSTLAGMVEAENMFLVDSADMSMIGKKYNRETGEFE